MADNKFVNKNGQLERKVNFSGKKQFYRVGKDIFDAATQRRITLPEWEQNWTDPSRSQQIDAPIGRTEALLPQSNTAQQTETAPAPLSQSDNFALILTNILNKAQGATYKDLVLKKRELQREVLNRQMSDIPEPLAGNLSYAEMTGLRSAKAKALSSDIDRNAADIAQYEFIFDKAKSISEEFAKNMKAPDNIVTAYARAIEADPDKLDEIIAAGKVNQKTFDAIMTKIDFSKLDTTKKKQEAELEMYKQKKAIDQQYETGKTTYGKIGVDAQGNDIYGFVDTKNQKVSPYNANIADVSMASAQDITNAIKQIESGGNYQAQGASGEIGAYQFMPSTWSQWSQEYLQAQGKAPQSLNPTPANQDAVAKSKISQWQAQGLTPQQIFAKWNSGSETGWENKIGTNEQGVAYNVPDFVQKGISALGGIVGKTQQLTATQLTEANNLAKQLYGGTTIRTKDGYNNFVQPIIDRMKAGESIDEISDSLRFKGQSPEFTGVVREAAQQITSGLNATQTETVLDKLDDIVSSNNQGKVQDFLKKIALQYTGNAEEVKQIRGKERTIEFLSEIQNDLNILSSNGINTDIFSGTVENTAKRIGQVAQPALRTLATKIQTAIQKYRHDMTGAQFSVPETQEYKDIFPSISATGKFNTATIQGLQDTFQGDIDFFYSFAMGNEAYNEIFKNKVSEKTLQNEYNQYLQSFKQ